jgi:hypothetical protein
MFTYGFFLLKGANFISDGSEHLLGVLSPGIIGGTPTALATLTLVLRY